MTIPVTKLQIVLRSVAITIGVTSLYLNNAHAQVATEQDSAKPTWAGLVRTEPSPPGAKGPTRRPPSSRRTLAVTAAPRVRDSGPAIHGNSSGNRERPTDDRQHSPSSTVLLQAYWEQPTAPSAATPSAATSLAATPSVYSRLLQLAPTNTGARPVDLDTAAPELNAPAPEPDSPTEDIEAPTTNNIVEPSDDRSFVADDITPVVDRGEEVTTNVAQLVESIRNDKLFDAEHTVRWSLDQALIEALVSSHRVSGLKLQPLVELQNVGIAYGQFDILGFVESTFEDASTPVADIFDSSNPAIQSRINNQQSELKPGLRKELQSGGRIEISQSYRSFDDNSGQLIPPDQAHSALELNMSKELLRGASRSVAMNQVLVAHHDTASARARSTAEIAEHLGEVTEAYWTVFAARGEVIARSEARENALKVLRELRARTDIDAERNLIAQTQTSVAQREIAINQAYNRLTNAQYLLVALINSPTLQLGTSRLELITASEPDLTSREIALEERLSTAIQRRPEIRAAAQSIKSSEVLRHFTINQLLPKLTFSVESSFNGLASERNIGAAIRDQFDDDLSYQLGLDLELPWGNRVARFSKRRAEYALAVAMSRWREAIENTKADVLTAGQDFVSVQQRYERQLEVLRFSTDELRYLQLRKSIAPAENAIPSLELTQILSAQDRQTEATTALVEAIAEKYRSLFRLNQATGIAVQEDVLPSESHLANPRFLKIYHQFLEDTPVLGRYANAVGAGTQARSRTFPKR